MKIASEASKILESTELKIKKIKDEYKISEVSENLDE